MGGNCLKKCVTKRKNIEEYNTVSTEVLTKLSRIFPNVTANIIPAYESKKDFGDLDVLVRGDQLPDCWEAEIVHEFSPNQTFRNGSVFSFDFDEFQIDLILAPEKDYPSSYFYYSFNDLGNLMGVLFNRLGLKYGHKGLLYVLKIDTYKFKEITVTQDPASILTLLGLEYSTYKLGFEDLLSIFEFVSSSKYFNSADYNLASRSNKSRVRDRKRPTYIEFLKYLENIEPKTDLPTLELDELFTLFPKFKQDHDYFHKEMYDTIAFRTKFNGRLVMDWVGLSGPELGNFMHHLRNKYDNNEGIRYHFQHLSTDAIKARIISEFETYEEIL